MVDLFDRRLYRRISPEAFVRYDPHANTFAVVPADRVPDLAPALPRRVRLSQAKPNPSSQFHRGILLTMLEFQKRAHDAGYPRAATPYLKALADLARDPEGPKKLRMSLTAQDAPKKFGCAMVPLPREAAERLRELGSMIRDEDLADDGRESEPHVTVRYGLHSTDVAEVLRLMKGVGPIEMKLGRVSVFRGAECGKDFDVLKIDVDSPALVQLHDDLGNLPHTDTHADYCPHATIAYVKAGLGDQIAAQLPPLDLVVKVGAATYSTAEKQRGTVRLSWTASQTKRNTVKAVGAGSDTGRTLYGSRAIQALKAQDARGGRSHGEHREHVRQSDEKAKAILLKIHTSGVTPEHLTELATHLPALGLPALRNARVLLSASFGGAKQRKAMVLALTNHVRGLVDKMPAGQEAVGPLSNVKGPEQKAEPEPVAEPAPEVVPEPQGQEEKTPEATPDVPPAKPVDPKANTPAPDLPKPPVEVNKPVATPTAKATIPAGHTHAADLEGGGVVSKGKDGEFTTHFPTGEPERQAKRLAPAIAYAMDDLKLDPDLEDGLLPLGRIVADVQRAVPDASDNDIMAALSHLQSARVVQGHALNEVKKLQDGSRGINAINGGKDLATSTLWKNGRATHFWTLAGQSSSGITDAAEKIATSTPAQPAVASTVMDTPAPTPPPTPAAPPDYRKFDAILANSQTREQAEKIARATGHAVRPLDPPPPARESFEPRIREAMSDPSKWDAILADAAHHTVDRDLFTELAVKIHGPGIKDTVKRLPKAKQIALIRDYKSGDSPQNASTAVDKAGSGGDTTPVEPPKSGGDKAGGGKMKTPQRVQITASGKGFSQAVAKLKKIGAKFDESTKSWEIPAGYNWEPSEHQTWGTRNAPGQPQDDDMDGTGVDRTPYHKGG